MSHQNLSDAVKRALKRKLKGHAVPPDPFKDFHIDELRDIAQAIYNANRSLTVLGAVLTAKRVAPNDNTQLASVKTQATYFRPVLASVLASVLTRIAALDKASGNAPKTPVVLDTRL